MATQSEVFESCLCVTAETAFALIRLLAAELLPN
jgi:hypothetical protein